MSSRLILGLAPLGLLAAAPDSAASPAYQISLDERNPAVARFGLSLPAAEARLTVEGSTESMMIGRPACATVPLASKPGFWIKPAGCRLVTWSARLVDHDTLGVDATSPQGAWSPRNRLWILTGRLPWLRLERQPPASAEIRAALADGRTLARRYTITPGQGAPLYLLVGAGTIARYAQRGFAIQVMGDAPRGTSAARLQREVGRIWLRWRRDILPADAPAVDRLEVAWVRPIAGMGPGFFASTGSDAILMQYVPDPEDADPDIKLRTAILLIGAHEGFHALLGAIPGARPAWLNESWASYFAYRAARRHLSGASLALADALIETPAESSILGAQALWDKGDQAQASVFYSKGVRFWAAVEALLTNPGNETGKLAALIQASKGMQGLDWHDSNAIAAYLDRYSDGRVGTIVRCYLVERDCPAEPATAADSSRQPLPQVAAGPRKPVR